MAIAKTPKTRPAVVRSFMMVYGLTLSDMEKLLGATRATVRRWADDANGDCPAYVGLALAELERRMPKS